MFKNMKPYVYIDNLYICKRLEKYVKYLLGIYGKSDYGILSEYGG